jgi:hypothetical protein
VQSLHDITDLFEEWLLHSGQPWKPFLPRDMFDQLRNDGMSNADRVVGGS